MQRYYKASPLLKADTGESADGDVVEFIGSSNGLGYVRLLNEDLRLAYGIFVSHAISVAVRDRLTLTGPTSDTEWLVSFGIETQTNHGGAGLAWRLTPTLRFGASLFLLFDRRSVRNQLAGGAIAPDTEQAFDFVSRRALAFSGTSPTPGPLARRCACPGSSSSAWDPRIRSMLARSPVVRLA
ncbi:MAG: hypothetical protein ACI9MR_003360 [Myxococcota bacterium]|jgi:hypothetical protein